MEKRTTRLKDCLHYALGPFAKLLDKEPLPKVISNWGKVFVPPFRYLKDWVLYGNQTVEGKVDKEVWLMVASKNNLDTLKFLETEIEGAQIVLTNKKVGKYGNYARLLFHHALFYWPQFFWELGGLWRVFGAEVPRKPHFLSEVVGVYEAGIKIFSRHRPKLLIFTNDHFHKMRSLIWAAKQVNIPTVYIQHASVTNCFPPLIFDLSLLEGQDALDKYQGIGPISGKVELIGMPKIDEYLQFRNHQKNIRKIAVCTTVLDQESIVLNLLDQLNTAFPELAITFRKHPRDERVFILPEGVMESDPSKESIFELLKTQDLLIAGDTSTHIEAILLNIPCIYFQLNPNFYDYYDYIKQGLIKEITSIEKMVDYINEIKSDKPNVVHQAQYYNAVAGTSQDGQSKKIAINHINQFLRELSN